MRTERTPDHEPEYYDNRTVPLRDYIERVLDEKDRALKIALDATQKALDLRERELDRRLAELNNLRREVIEDRSKLVTREKHDGDLSSFETRIEPLEDMRGKFVAIIAGSMAVAGVLGALGSRLLG